MVKFCVNFKNWDSFKQANALQNVTVILILSSIGFTLIEAIVH